MKVLFINSVCGIGSTGRICTDLAQQLEAEGNEVKIAYGRKGTVPEQFQNMQCVLAQILTARCMQFRHGCSIHMASAPSVQLKSS